MEHPNYSKSKKQVLDEIIEVYPPIKEYLSKVTWDRSDHGWHPIFNNVPKEVLLELDKALRGKTS